MDGLFIITWETKKGRQYETKIPMDDLNCKRFIQVLQYDKNNLNINKKPVKN